MDIPTVNPAEAYLVTLAPGSRRTMRGALTIIAETISPGATLASIPWHQLRYQQTSALRVALAQRYAASTANKIICALRGVLKEARRLGLMTAEDERRATDMKPIKAMRLTKGRMLSTGELGRLMHSCDSATPAGARDAAILAILYGAGLRRSELVHLDVADIQEDGSLIVRAGKGRKDRRCYLSHGTRPIVAYWLRVRGGDPGPLFCSISKSGELSYRRLSDQSVLTILRRRALLAGIARFSPHDLRRTFISTLLQAGVDLATAQQLAGHASVETTARYDRRGEDSKRLAVERLPDIRDVLQ